MKYAEEAAWEPPNEAEEEEKETDEVAETVFGLNRGASAWGFDGPAEGTLILDPEAPAEKAAGLVGAGDFRPRAATENDTYGDF